VHLGCDFSIPTNSHWFSELDIVHLGCDFSISTNSLVQLDVHLSCDFSIPPTPLVQEVRNVYIWEVVILAFPILVGQVRHIVHLGCDFSIPTNSTGSARLRYRAFRL
jgi:hypothetical protein